MKGAPPSDLRYVPYERVTYRCRVPCYIEGKGSLVVPALVALMKLTCETIIYLTLDVSSWWRRATLFLERVGGGGGSFICLLCVFPLLLAVVRSIFLLIFSYNTTVTEARFELL